MAGAADEVLMAEIAEYKVKEGRLPNKERQRSECKVKKGRGQSVK
jgi:hypothetical protein